MKKKRVRSIVICSLTLAVFITALSIQSCSKQEVGMDIINEESSVLPYFENAEEFGDFNKSVFALSHEELKAMEDSKGHKSFGRICDEFYYSIDPNKFNSTDEIKEFASKQLSG